MKSFFTVTPVGKALLAGAVVCFLTAPAYAVSQTYPLEKGSAAIGSSFFRISDDPVLAGAQKFVDSMAQRALDFLANESLTQDQKANEFRKLLQDSFDMETIGRFALGRYWRSATPAQQKEYQKLFRDMIVKVYSERFLEYKGQNVETRSGRIDGDKDTIVTSFIVPEDGGAEIQVDWRVRHKNNRYQIVDVIVEGVSMSVTQRSDFSSVIQRGGGDIQVLLDHLNK